MQINEDNHMSNPNNNGNYPVPENPQDSEANAEALALPKQPAGQAVFLPLGGITAAAIISAA
jgi:hypothetical protein